MTLLIAYSHSPEGAAALDQGRSLATRLQAAVLVFDLDTEATAEDRHVPTVVEGGAGDERWIGYTRHAHEPVDDLLDTAQELDAGMIVVGIRRRSPVGKLLMGSRAQRIILGAVVPVVAVKVSADHG